MQTDVCIRIINEKMNKKFLVRWVFDVPAIIAFGFSWWKNKSFWQRFTCTPVVPVEESLALPATSKEIEVKQEEPEKEESVEPEKVEVIDSAIKDISEDVQIKEEIIETKEEIEEKTVEVNLELVSMVTNFR